MASVDSSATVSIAGYRDNFTIINSNGVVTVTSKINVSDVRTYQSPKLIKFVDKWTSFEISGSAGQVYRLYQAAFNRKPDQDGLGFWIKANQDGVGLTDIAGGFIASDEFKKLYGQNAEPSVFVDAMYQNVLHRAGETTGFNWWVQQVSNGADRRAVLIGFADSDENKAALSAGMMNGFDYVPFRTGGPIIPKSSSYANNKEAASLGPQAYPGDAGDATAFADFFQAGTFSMVTNTLEYDPTDPNTKNKFGHIKFYEKVNGVWTDSTSRLLADNVGCLHPRKALITDLNGDGKPDVFFACHGFDAPPFVGEKQIVLLSQPDGTYKNTKTAYDCFCHGAAAADLTTRGYADIVVADQTVEGKPYFLMNNKDGTFTKDTNRLPADLQAKQIWTAELVDATSTGKYDVFLAGADPEGDGYQINPTIFSNDGNNRFVNTTKVEIPLLQSVVGTKLGMTLDVEFNACDVYLLRTFTHGTKVNYAMSVQKSKICNGTITSTELYSHIGPYAATNNTWFPWFNLNQGSVITLDDRFDLFVRQ